MPLLILITRTNILRVLNTITLHCTYIAAHVNDTDMWIVQVLGQPGSLHQILTALHIHMKPQLPYTMRKDRTRQDYW